MRKSQYSPDAFMKGLYNEIYKSPYEKADTREDALKAGEWVKENAEAVDEIVHYLFSFIEFCINATISSFLKPNNSIFSKNSLM